MPEILRPGSRKQRRSPKKNIAGIVVLPFVPFDTLQKYDLGRKDTPSSR